MGNNQKPGKQHTAEFEQCIEQVMKQDHQKGSAFAICTTTFEKARKPIFIGESEAQKLHLFSESIKLSGNKVSGVAIHPKRIFHPEEGVEHVYLREELENAAPTLIGKPFGIDHMYVLPPPNVITNAWYDPKEDGVAFEGTVDDQVVEQIGNKAFKGLSIELNWLRPGGRVEYANGVVPRNFELTSVHLLRNFPPGDRDAFIKLWNGIMEQLVLGPPRTLDDRVQALEKSWQEVQAKLDVLSGKIDALTGGQGVASAPVPLSSLTQPKLQVGIPVGEGQKNAANTPSLVSMKETEWTAETINDLPDSSFAVISKGGEKDDQGKTAPRSLRHLPHHNSSGSLDLAHLRNALARLPQTGLSSEERVEAKRHLCAHAKDSEIVSAVCGEEPPKQGESVTIVDLRKQLVETEARLVDAQRQVVAVRGRFRDFYEAIKGTHPVLGVQRSWSLGPQKLIQEQLRVLREFASSSRS